MLNRNLVVISDIRRRWKWVSLVTGFVLVLMLMGILPSTSPLSVWSNIQEYVFSYGIPFLYVPSFVLLLGGMLKRNEWTILRKFKYRSDIVTYDITLVYLLVTLFTGVILVAGILATTIVQRYLYSSFDYHSVLQYVPDQENPSSAIVFFILLYALLVFIGLLYIFIRSWFPRRAIASTITIALFVAEFQVIGITPRLFLSAYLIFPDYLRWSSVLGISTAIFILTMSLYKRGHSLDFVDREDTH